MGIIRIIANGIELDFVKESLTVRKDNNAFITDFKVSHTSHPFLIIENERTKMALGTRDITSVQQRKSVPVTIIEMGERYYGEIEVLQYLNGFRKCNLKYGSDLIKIFNKKLSELLPVISIIPGETEPVPFSEEALDPVSGSEHWKTYPLQFIDKIFPDVNIGFPKMIWKDKFGENTDADDEWYDYERYYNNYAIVDSQLQFIENTFVLEGQTVDSHNRNVPSPQLFLLGILKMAFENAGYTIHGNFVNDPFIRRLQVLSLKHNLCKVNLMPAAIEHPLYTFTYYPRQGPLMYSLFYKNIWLTSPGTYTFKYKIQETVRAVGIVTDISRFIYVTSNGSNVEFAHDNNADNSYYEGEITVDIDTVGAIHFRYEVLWPYEGLPLSFELKGANEPKIVHMMHPTIPLGRYAPEMTLSTFVNEVKNLFCLDITQDDQARKVHLNFASGFLKNGSNHIARKSIIVKEEMPPEKIAYVLKYANTEDTTLYITRTSVQPNYLYDPENDYVQVMESRFKCVQLVNGMVDLALAEKKEGTGLMIYNPDDEAVNETYSIPRPSSNYNGQDLSMDGLKGIYQKYWKVPIRFLLNGSEVELEGPFTETEISQINRLQRIYINHQVFVVLSREYSDTQQNNYKVRLKLKSINF